MIVGVTGASGFIGKRVVKKLQDSGHEVKKFVRREAKNDDEIFWSPAKKEIDIQKFQELDAIIHLAGESIATTSTQSRLTHFGPRLEKRKIEYFAVIDHSTNRVKELRWLESINANFGKSDAEVVWEIEKSGSCEL